jgi:hypothetical protein
MKKLPQILILLAVGAVLVPAVVWGLGVQLPARLIDSGVEDFEGAEKKLAEAALDKVYLHTRETASFMVDKRVTRVWWCPGVDSDRERSRALWALSVLEAALDNRHPAGPIRRGGEQFVRLVLRLYTDPTTDAAIKSRAMDAFDRLMERYAYEARRALEEWDRR